MLRRAVALEDVVDARWRRRLAGRPAPDGTFFDCLENWVPKARAGGGDEDVAAAPARQLRDRCASRCASRWPQRAHVARAARGRRTTALDRKLVRQADDCIDETPRTTLRVHGSPRLRQRAGDARARTTPASDDEFLFLSDDEMPAFAPGVEAYVRSRAVDRCFR